MTFTVRAPQPHPRLGGGYEINGVRYPRVTSILGVISRPSLEQWRQKVGVEEANRISQLAADHGTALHQILEAIDRNQMTMVPDALVSWVMAYEDWKARNVAEVLMVERVVVHERHHYAGQLDRLYLMRSGEIVVGDLKSGKSVDGIYKLQLCAYREALAAMGERVDRRRLVLHLPSDRPGTITPVWFDDDRDYKAWRACLRLWRWNDRNRTFFRGTMAPANRNGAKA